MTHTDKRWLDFPAIFSLVAALLVASARLSATNWTDHLNIVVTLTLIGVVIGIALGYSRLSSRLAFFVGLGYTVIAVVWQLETTIGGEGTRLAERLVSLGGRLSITTNQLLHNQPSNDSLLFLANMALLFWLIAITAGYQLVRHGRPWQSLVIAGITLIIIDLYSPGAPRSNFYSASFLLLSLLLLTQVHFMKSKDNWQEKGVAIDSDTEFNLGRGALIVGLLIILLAWNIPTVVLAFNPDTIEQRNLTQTWQQFRQRFENATASLKGPLTLEQESYGDQLGLGTGSPLSDDLVLTIKPSLPEQPNGTAYYWRGRSYDYYDSKSGWKNTGTSEKEEQANSSNFPSPDWSGRVREQFTINPQKNLGVFYAPSVPLTISRPSKVVISDVGDGQYDLVGVIASPPIRGGETYEVTSMISAPTVAEMRSSSTEYSDWVKGKYLQLPSSMPARISELAQQITAGLDNPYDKATAVTAWLRKEITYTPIISPPPSGQDPIDYFLFESKTGFCNYYATAEVLLLRSVGVPARLAAGYAQGEFNQDTKMYEVRRKQSHAWPEVYFEGIGWVEFEPTASQPDIARVPGTDETAGNLNPGADPNLPGNTRDRAQRDNEPEDIALPGQQNPAAPRPFPWGLVVLGAVILTAGVLAFVYYLKRKANEIDPLPVLIETRMRSRGLAIPRWIRRWSHLTTLTPMERIFLTIEWVLLLLGKRLDPSSTPTEAVDELNRALPSGAPYAKTMLEEYQRTIYSPNPGSIDKARTASRMLWKEGLSFRFHQLLEGNRREEARI